jgi:hypothetical protein
MTNKDLLRLLAVATTLPWYVPEPGWQPPESMGMRSEYPEEGWYPEHSHDYRINASALDCEEENGVAYQLTKEDADLVAAAVNALPGLIDENFLLKGTIDRMRALSQELGKKAGGLVGESISEIAIKCIQDLKHENKLLKELYELENMELPCWFDFKAEAEEMERRYERKREIRKELGI